jgi:signal transduction histidine kinase
LRIKGQTFGVIKVENKIEGNLFSSEDETIFRIIANVIALTIEKAKLQLRIENQLKTISAMAGHRIHNLLTLYDGIAWKLKSLLSLDTINKEPLLSIQDELTEATSNTKRLVSEFRKYGKPIELKKTVSNINEILQNEIWLAEPPAEIKIIQHLNRSIPNVEVDVARFTESIKELLGNAIRIIKEINGNGNIWISTRLVPDEKDQVKSILIRIEDDGPGIAPDFPIFEPFHSSDPTRTGLGLATVKENFETHGGSIQLVQGDRTGACFDLILPC